MYAELSKSQNTWDVRWLEKNQSEHVKNAFFLMGLHDILILRSRFAANQTGDLRMTVKIPSTKE